MARRRRSTEVGMQQERDSYGRARTVLETTGEALPRYAENKRYEAAAEAIRATASNVAEVARYVSRGGRLKDAAGELASATRGWAGHALKTGAAAQFATEGVKSAVTQGVKMLDDVSSTGGFTREGWKNLLTVDAVKDFGKGLAGSVMDVASGMTFGALPNGDGIRSTMSVSQPQPAIQVPAPAKSTFQGSIAGDIARKAVTKASDAHATLSLIADGAPADIVGADGAKTARELSAAAGRANYWTQVEAANKANADYADGVISKEERDELVAKAEQAKDGTSGQEMWKAPNETLADRHNEGASGKVKEAFGYQPYMDQTRRPSETKDTSASDWLTQFAKLTSPAGQPAETKKPLDMAGTETGKPSDITGTARYDTYRRQQEELKSRPIEDFIGSGAEQDARETRQLVDEVSRQMAGMTQEQKSSIMSDAAPDSQQGLTEDEKEDRAAEKAGSPDRFALSRNFLATDRVPDSIFGYPIASRREDYTPEDIEFFRKHPEAGGYYDLGEEPDGEEQGAVGAGAPMLFGVVPIGPAGTRAIDRAIPGGSRNTGELASGVMASKGLVVPDPPLRKDGLARLWRARTSRWFNGTDGDKITLGDVLDFTDHGGGRVLAKAYPWLPSLPIGSEDVLRNSEGEPLRGIFHAYNKPQPTDRAHGAITISREPDWRRETDGKSDVWTTILHEMVHAIQEADPDMLPLRSAPETYAQSLAEWQPRVTEQTADSRAKITAGSADSYGKQVMSSAFREGNHNVPEDPLPLVINVEKKGD